MNVLRNSNHINLLLRIAQDFKAVHDMSAKDLERRRLRIFCSKGMEFEDSVASRLSRLKKARDNIERDDWQANRIWLVCLAHEVECISQWTDIYRLTARGIGVMSAAKSLAKQYIDTVDSDIKRGKNIVRILIEGGPTSLLLDGGIPSSK